MNDPLVSIAMPVRNCEETIMPAVRSILNQSLRDWELIVIDDGSTDGTFGRLREFQDDRIRIIHDGTCKGLPIRLNEAVAVARAGYVARMDGDDVSYPHRLESQLTYMRSHPKVDLLGGSILVFGSGGRVVGKRGFPENHAMICRHPHAGFPMAHPTFFGRTDWYRDWKFDARAGGACDQDLLLRASAKSVFANMPGIVLGYREDRVVLQKSLRYRLKFARSLVRQSRNQGIHRLLRGLALSIVKSAADVIAVYSGLQHRMLRHRASSITMAEATAWSRVWNEATRLEARHVASWSGIAAKSGSGDR
jgi:glycosyltransferase involved in cell wall biosynthesis